MSEDHLSAAPSDPFREQLQAALGDAYLIERELASRSAGTRVFVAKDANGAGRHREIVIKVLLRDRSPAFDIARFKREIAYAASRLEERHVVPPIVGGDIDGMPYVTMRYVGGESLKARLTRDRTLPIEESLRILRDVARALAEAHSFGILHRALRASKVMLVRDGAVVTDFGIVRALTIATGVVPDSNVDSRSDIGDFGALGYELLTGEAPLGDAPTLISKRREDVTPALSALIMRCMSPVADNRPQSAGEIADILDEIISPSDFGILGQLGLTNSSTVEARSDYYRSRGALGLVVIGVFAAVAGFFTWRSTRAADGGAPPPAATSIAVAPFATGASDSTTAYIADAMTDEIAGALSSVKGIVVESRDATTAAIAAFGSDRKKIGDRLQISGMLTAQLNRTGTGLQLAAQLVNPSNGKSIWSKTYAGPDAVQLEDSVARAVAGALKIPSSATQPRIVAGTTNAAARDAYVRGRFALRAGSGDETSLRHAVDGFNEAVSTDPRFADAWAGLATAWSMLSDDFVAPKEAVPHVRNALAHGLAVDPSNASLRFTHGLVAYLYDRDARAAQTLMAGALTARVDIAGATLWYPQILWTNGLRDSATAFLRHAVARDSTSPQTLTDAWRFARESGDALRAIEYCGKLKELRAGEWCDAIQKLDVAQSDAAIAIAQRAASVPGAKDMEARLQLLAVLVESQRIDPKHSDESAKLIADVDRAAASTSHSYLRADDIALMHGLIGDTTGTLQWFDRALSDGSAGIGALYWRTARNPVRTDPRLAAFAKKAGLQAAPAYWP